MPSSRLWPAIITTATIASNTRGELVKIETEGPCQFYDRELDQDEPEAASEEEAAGLGKAPSASAIKICCKTREKNEGGAQKFVIQRVRNSAGSVTSRGFQPPPLKKSRVWSKAISAMTRPRRRSTALRRGRVPTTPCLSDDGPKRS